MIESVKKVLILSSPDDAHADSVTKHLRQMKLHVDFFRFEEFTRQCSISFSLGMGVNVCLLEREAGNLDLNSYLSIWHRRPGQVSCDTKFPERWIDTMVQQEARNGLDGMLRSLSCTWMNFPLNDAACAQKLWQLQIAEQVGLSIPETIVTNKPEIVRQFFDECDGEVIYKLLGEGSNFSIPANETPRGVSTLPLRKEDLSFLNQVVHAPHLFQKCIKKAFDLRVTIVGHKLFCIRIDSQSGEGKTDWRNDYSVAMEAFELPGEIQTKCLNLMRRLGLNYGALDFILTPDDQYVFLEINCAGQYLWIEQRTSLQISKEIANLLAGAADSLVASITAATQI